MERGAGIFPAFPGKSSSEASGSGETLEKIPAFPGKSSST
jgi:hypothetical protein